MNRFPRLTTAIPYNKLPLPKCVCGAEAREVGYASGRMLVVCGMTCGLATQSYAKPYDARCAWVRLVNRTTRELS